MTRDERNFCEYEAVKVTANLSPLLLSISLFTVILGWFSEGSEWEGTAKGVRVLYGSWTRPLLSSSFHPLNSLSYPRSLQPLCFSCKTSRPVVLTKKFFSTKCKIANDICRQLSQSSECNQWGLKSGPNIFPCESETIRVIKNIDMQPKVIAMKRNNGN